ncbi:hypothetical protein HG536_0E04300 [Torulaspora globosa]|uniref:PH domain-containing protein n=1 Tax=Torulaspora globosa TaxID=48254 RepID=A0A7G3ZJ33_9SACH|nr:uncharacterized protein HG536_0E04300 [Torulaspora globosa]QLL33519.1 hypothetical protein HG536_0E04300 [Torulaspora globosa]
MPSLERARAILGDDKQLDEDKSRECFRCIFEPTLSFSEPEGYLSLVGAFVLQCNPRFLCNSAIRNVQFWHLFKEILEKATSEELIIYLNTLLRPFLERPEKFKDSYTSLCQAASSDDLILETLALNLSMEDLSSDTAAGILNCISALFACHTYLLTFSPADAAHIIPNFMLQSLETGLCDVLTVMLSVGDSRIEIINKLVRHRREMLTFLKSFTIHDYETPLKNKLLTALNKASGEQRIKLEETAGFQNMNNVSLLQALNITIFLNSKNLTFLKTFAEQQLFGTRPFPLFYACLHVCDTTDEMIEKLEKKNTDIVHNIIFSLNEDKLMYALMDRLLKSWVESQAESEEDLNSLLMLMPIIFERINKSIPDSSNLSPREYLRLALNVIQEVNYKLARQLQLDALTETAYEKWSKHVGYFDDMLANQVHDYLHHQRLLYLQKGTWVYAENPLDPKIKSPKVYFMVLSANQAKLLVREYTGISERTPFTEENEILTPSEAEQSDEKSKTRVIPISSISFFTSERILSNDKSPTDSHLVNVIQKNVYTKVEFCNESDKSLLVVFFHTKEAIYSWLDGLQLVCCIKHRGGLSNGTTDQIDTLIDIRKSVQMMNLTEDAISPNHSDSDDEEYYDINTLKEITSDFYYE